MSRINSDKFQFPRLEQVIFLGTGTSCNIPYIRCLTDPSKNCKVCVSSLLESGRRNRRRNTSIILKIRNYNSTKFVLIDCGKNFYEAAIEFFPKNEIRSLDAIIITHSHLDAVGGLDYCREWSSTELRNTRGKKEISSSYIVDSKQNDFLPLFCSVETAANLKQMYSYMFNKECATGSGIVPQFELKILEKEATSFKIHSCWNIEVQILPVEHGFKQEKTGKVPYMNWGLRIDDFIYISDASKIPEETMQKAEGSQVFVIDTLQYNHHPSHLNLDDSLKIILSMAKIPRLMICTDLSHEIDHYELSARLKNYETRDFKPVVAYDGMLLRLRSRLLEIEESD